MNFASLALLTLSTLVLRSGERIDVQGIIREHDGRVVFRSAAGSLYSIPLSEIDQEATRAASEARNEIAPDWRKFKVSPEQRDRLLRELEKSHSGKPAQVQRLLEEPPPPPTREEIAEGTAAEWEWRRAARAHEESVRRAKEDLQMLITRAERLNAEILTLTSFGFKPRQFTYQIAALHKTREQIPYAELEVTRAERARDEFREDARRQGVLPGWLR